MLKSEKSVFSCEYGTERLNLAQLDVYPEPHCCQIFFGKGTLYKLTQHEKAMNRITPYLYRSGLTVLQAAFSISSNAKMRKIQ
jgi:hypothetical protein